MIEAIKEAVFQNTGFSFDEFTEPDKKREKYFARLIFAYFCMKLSKMNYRSVAVIVKRSPSTVFRYTEFYLNEKKVNPDFRKLATLTEKKLTSDNVLM